MEITGPFLDRAKKRNGQPACWYLRYSTPKLKADGTSVLDDVGKPALQRHRPFYESKAKAEADKPRILEQHEKTGSGQFLFDRSAASDYEQARSIVGDIRLVEIAKFWRLHHPDKLKKNLGEHFPAFLADIEMRHGRERHYGDVKSRGGAFLKAGFSDRYPDTVTREEILSYVKALPDAAPRTKRNHKTAICEFFNWLRDQNHIAANPAAGIKKRMLPKETRKEIQFLSPENFVRYLHAAERYDPEIVAHELVQLIAGVRADDEMADFRGEYVLPQTKEIVIPAHIAKTGAREVITGLEENFWVWWADYGQKEGLLRPRNYTRRWSRIRALASILDTEKADHLAEVPVKPLLHHPEIRALIKKWPWNARRRSFCTYHIAKHESAAKTALIMRHRGSSYTLHNSYRGLGITREQGIAYFEVLPSHPSVVIRPKAALRDTVFANTLGLLPARIAL